MDFPNGDFVLVSRDEVPVGTFAGAWDPQQHAVYGPFDVDVREGDVLTFRGVVRRIVGLPERWRNPFTGWEAGTVCKIEAAQPFLRDLGTLQRKTGVVFNKDLNTNVPVFVTVWSGPCLVDPPTTEGSEVEAGQQKLSIQPFTVSVPLEVTDVKPDDRFTVTASADPRMVGRPLTVTRTKGASLAQVRVFTAIENQG